MFAQLLFLREELPLRHAKQSKLVEPVNLIILSLYTKVINYPAVRTGSSNTRFFFFFFFYPAVRTGSSNTPFFFFFFFFCCRGQLPQTCARSKQYLPVNFVRSAFIRQNFHESWCRKLPAI